MKSLKSNPILFSLLMLLAALSSFAAAQTKQEKSAEEDSNTIWLDSLNINRYTAPQEWGFAKKNTSCVDKPITIAGKVYKHGIGTHVRGKMKVNLFGEATRFQSYVGVDDEVETNTSSINFEIYGDGKKLYDSGVLKYKTPAKYIDIDVSGIKTLLLFANVGGDTNHYDHADWADAKIIMKKDAKNKPVLIGRKPESEEPLAPPAPDTPRINGPEIIGAGINKDVLYYIPTTGKRPIKFTVDSLPEGLKLNAEKGIISGKVKTKGNYKVKITAENALGQFSRVIEFSIGNGIALTPPMGWNSWNGWGCDVNDEKIRAAADAFVSSGLINHGWTYINIDDCWQGGRDSDTGAITSNERFPDMKSLSDYIHDKGLKFGLYSCVGRKTCAGYPGTQGFDDSDVISYSQWGADYIKMDWCFSEGLVAKEAYKKFGDALAKNATRDIVYSICNWGEDKPWVWGAEVGGNCWRTTFDILDEWDRVKFIGFKSSVGLSKYAKPGHWNDPDMFVVGYLGGAWGKKVQRITNLSPNQQYAHVSLWCLLSSPLLIGCDLSKLNDFTMSLLTNDEVIAINQDRKGTQADLVKKEGASEVWMKELADGSKAVGVFYINEDEYSINDVPDEIKFNLKWSDLGISGKQTVRDLWRQKDIGTFEDSAELTVPFNGVALVKISPAGK